MADLFVGGEMGAFVPSSAAVNEVTTLGTYDTAFARCAINVEGASEYAESASWASETDLWWHCDFYHTGATLGTGRVLSFYNGTTEVFRLDCTAWAAQIATYQMYYWNGSAFVTIGSTVDVIDDTRHTLDLNMVVNASGSAAMYLSGTLRTSGSADTSGMTGITKARLRSPVTDTYFSQCIAADESTVGRRLMTGYASATGNASAWTGDYTSIDEAIYSDADFIFSATNGQREQFSMTLVGALTGYTVRSVGVTARAKRGASGPQNLQLNLRTSSTDYDSASILQTTGYTANVNIWEDNPNTGVDWTVAEASTIQFGVEANT